MRSVELFAGAGGLAMGCEIAGFEHLAVVEWDRWACDTVRENQNRGYPVLASWNLHEGDIREFDWSSIPQNIELLAGGPPCQPFSIGGKHKAYEDNRDMFPATAEIIRHLRPKSFIVENVKGLTRSTFANYFHYIQLQLEFPELPPDTDEDWADHLARLQIEKTSGKHKGSGLTYNVIPTLVNAADYGVPQKRERVFIVGFRDDLGIEWSFPAPTHSHDALLYDQWVTGEYWKRHGITPPKTPDKLAARVAKLAQANKPPVTFPWRTVRDAIQGLPDPQSRMALQVPNHVFQPGARVYPGHTGSPLDLPAKTLKAGGQIPPGYKDSKKDAGEFDKFGDLIIWKEMIARAKTENRPMIFISDDAKEDWWWIHRGRKMGPRPELIEEFHTESGQDFHIYEFSQFLRFAADRFPEIEVNVAKVEESILADEQARRHQDNLATALAREARLRALEDERDQIVSVLSGTPGGDTSMSGDRMTLRARLDEINSEIKSDSERSARETTNKDGKVDDA